MERILVKEDIVNLLKEEYNKKESSVVYIKGEFGVGKSSVIFEFINQNRIKALHYFALDESDKANRDSFRDTVLDFNELPCLRNVDFSWDLSFKCYMGGLFLDKRVVIIENVHRLIKYNYHFPKSLFDSYIKYLKEHNVLLIVTGELTESYLEEIFLSENIKTVTLEKLSFEDFKKYYPTDPIRMYALTNGLSYYMNHFTYDNYLENIYATILNKSHILYELPYFDLSRLCGEGLRKQLLILKAVVKGYHTIEDVTNYLQIERKDVFFMLNRLVDLNILKKDISINGLVLSKNYEIRYAFENSFMEVWLKLNYCNRQSLNKSLVHKININKSLESIFQETYINICYQYLKNKKISYQYIAKYYEDNIMVDLVSVDEENKKIIIGDCFYLEEEKGIDCYELLLDLYNKYIKPKYKNYQLEKIIIFNEYGFSNQLINLQKEDPRILLLSNKK